jgi:hypothetical protein
MQKWTSPNDATYMDDYVAHINTHTIGGTLADGSPATEIPSNMVPFTDTLIVGHRPLGQRKMLASRVE